MREIEFRGKDLENKWRYGFYSPLIWYPSYEQTPSIKEFKGGDIQIKKDTLCQYTERKDKNGKKIFEGDIVYFDNKNYPLIVVWDEYQWGLADPKNTGPSVGFTVKLANDCEIVGNIYDSPELLGEEI